MPLRPASILVAAALIALAALGGFAAFRYGPDLFALPSLRLIDARIKDRQFERATRLAERLTRTDPRDPRVWYALARARAGAGDLEGSIEALRRIPDWSPRKADALFFEGKALLELKRGRQAESAFRACIEHDASGSGLGVNARLELLALYAMEERTDEFRQVFGDVYPRLDAADRLAVLTMRMRLDYEQTKPETNAENLRQFVASDPRDAHARAGYAAALDKGGRLDDARREYLRAVADAPDSIQIRERAIDLLHRQGDVDGVARLLSERGLGSDGRPEICKFLAMNAQSSGQVELEIQLLQQAAQLSPESPEYKHRLAQALIRDGRKDEAAQVAAERARLGEAREALRLAWNDFAIAYEADPQRIDADLLHKLAVACRSAGLEREAEAWSREADQIQSSAQDPKPRRQ